MTIDDFYAHYLGYLVFGIIVLILATAWIVGNIQGWQAVRQHFPNEMYPFSWRIFLGSKRYIRWAVKQWNQTT